MMQQTRTSTKNRMVISQDRAVLAHRLCIAYLDLDHGYPTLGLQNSAWLAPPAMIPNGSEECWGRFERSWVKIAANPSPGPRLVYRKQLPTAYWWEKVGNVSNLPYLDPPRTAQGYQAKNRTDACTRVGYAYTGPDGTDSSVASAPPVAADHPDSRTILKCVRLPTRLLRGAVEDAPRNHGASYHTHVNEPAAPESMPGRSIAFPTKSSSSEP